MSSNIMNWIEKTILPFAGKIQRNRYLQAIQAGFMMCMPIMLVGSISIILTRPLVDYTTMAVTESGYTFFKNWQLFIENYGAPLLLLRSMTLYSISLWVCLAVSYHLASYYKMNTILTPMLNLLMFFILCSSKTPDGGISNDYWGGEGLFASIIIAIVITELYRFLIDKKVGTIQMPEMVPPALKSSFSSIFPILFITSVCTIISIFFNCIIGLSFPQAILACFHPLVIAIDNVFGLAISSILTQIVWWFGIHNTAITSMLEPLMMSNYASNAAQYAAGMPPSALPHIWTEPLWWNFMVIGGSGATLSVAFMLLRSKSKQLKTIGQISIIPALFNINEPIIFGLPIVLNPLFFIPWVFAQTFNGIASYICMDIGLVNKTFIYPGWNIPTPIGQFLATMDYRAIILAITLVVIDGLIYYPFLKVYEKQKLIEETAGISNL
ncbi:PTS system, lactose/cellobiose family IIC subunit [Tepidanaerobacter acetatoxydans Re1]|uniref:Permease IIC component n=1 Tax=Tepidanaerobacter acetatoxydans (strain DSM 21804 / JCM 16047 / Re1) TaxID=1209989 RepID=F4LRK2_TEPAE|nr:PTS transporter subunit EIIC [Tepidanaerobacter acetatoxydans]AEE90265.1 PTS system, lactose/cellobiose family IIC subunit [Tepidanaerobacter acetatoxydans Re1]CCP24734.1 PTS system, lactose/cellobiose family IIC subunit [Tepidanaerobacter acetatoxydans Re1]